MALRSCLDKCNFVGASRISIAIRLEPADQSIGFFANDQFATGEPVRKRRFPAEQIVSVLRWAGRESVAATAEEALG